MRRTILSVITSNFAGAGLGFALNIFLARILTVEEYGRINLIFSFVIIMFSFFEFNFGNAIVIFFNKLKNEYKGNSNELIFYINSIFFKYIFLVMIISFFMILILKNVYTLSDLESTVVAINFFLFLIYRYIITLYQALGEWKKFNIYNVLHNIVKILIMMFFIVLVPLQFDDVTKYNAALIGYLVFPIVFMVIILWNSIDNLKTFSIADSSYFFRTFKSIIIPLGVSNIFIIIAMRADNLIIEKVMGSEALGIYVAANLLALVFPLITSALRNVYLQQASSKDHNYLNTIINQQKKYAPLILLIFILSLLLAEPFFHILYGERYNDSIIIFKILLIPYIGGTFFTPLESYFYGHYPQIITYLKFFQMLIIVGCATALIYPFGLIGVAIAIVLSRIFGWLFVGIMAKRKLQTRKTV